MNKTLININQYFILLIISSCTALNSMEQNIILPLSLLQNPLSFLQNNINTTESFLTQCVALTNDKNLTPEDCVERIIPIAQKTEKNNRLFLIQECADGCFLSRMHNPHLRASFEKKASKLLKAQINTTPNSQVEYVSFGSGNALPEFIIATEVFLRNPNAQLKINLIDTVYRHALHTRKNNPNPFAIIPQSWKQLRAGIKQYVIMNASKPKIRKELFYILFTEIQHQQFIHWFAQQFPLANLSLHMYQSVDEYLEHNTATPAHVITTVDTMINMNIAEKILSHYHYLCLQTLKLNPKSLNIGLIPYFKPYALLFKLSLDKQNNESQETTFTYLQQNNTMYVTKQYLLMNIKENTEIQSAL